MDTGGFENMRIANTSYIKTEPRNKVKQINMVTVSLADTFLFSN